MSNEPPTIEHNPHEKRALLDDLARAIESMKEPASMDDVRDSVLLVRLASQEGNEFLARIENEISDLHLSTKRLSKRFEDHGLEVRWAGWLSFAVLCMIAWRVW